MLRDQFAEPSGAAAQDAGNIDYERTDNQITFAT